ncbi:MAG: hypothetical protein IJ094_09730 [Bacilli bacterium]|nr:hypothetical protein [Bacilli bacterium]
MDNKDKDVKSALDELFGSDFIEIDVNKEEKSNNIINDDLFDDIINSDIKKDDQDIINTNKKEENNKLNTLEEKNTNNNFVPNYVTTIQKKKENNKFNKLYLLLILIVVIAISIFFVYILYFNERTIKCVSKAMDVGYKYSDEYKIKHKGNKITYLYSSYKYTALNDDYKREIEVIKNEKLPILLNSNGMDGFTYTYESTDEYFKINGYIDFEKINFKSVDKLNQDLVKISFYKINSKLTYKDLKKSLEKDGYTCTNIK